MSLSAVMVMPGWTARIAVFVHRLIRIGLVEHPTVAKLLPSVERLGEQMVDSCDRVATVAGPAGAHRSSDPSSRTGPDSSRCSC